MSLGSNTGRHRQSFQRQIEQPLPYQPRHPKPPKPKGGGNIPIEVVVGFLAFIALMFLIRIW